MAAGLSLLASTTALGAAMPPFTIDAVVPSGGVVPTNVHDGRRH